MKLSEPQQHVIDRMKLGWQLGTDTIGGRCWLQKNGIGYGGETERVHGNTLSSLLRLSIVAYDVEGFPIRTYKLAESTK